MAVTDREQLGLLITRHIEFYSAAKKRDFATFYKVDLRKLDELPDFDIRQALRSLALEGVRETDDGHVEIPRDHCRVRMFDHGSTDECPQRAKVSIEPIISIGTLSRLVEDLGWPLEYIASQMDGGAFDMTLYGPNSLAPTVQCEIKVKPSEIDAMARYFQAVVNEGQSLDPKRTNWNRKVAALYASSPKLLWLLAPGPHERVFQVEFEAGALKIAQATSEDLRFNRVRQNL